MFTVEAIKQLAAAEEARQVQDNITHAFTSEGLAAIPDGMNFRDLETFMPTRRRQRGTFETTDIDSFGLYVEQHKEHGATVFINADHMKAVAVLNLGDKVAPGHCDNRAILTVDKTAAYSALQFLCGRSHNQKDLAEFLEDWVSLVVCMDETGATIEPKKALAAVRKLTVESMQKVESAQNSLSATRSTFEQVNATSADPIPVRLVFDCAPYNGLRIHSFDVRVGVLTSGKDPAFSCRMVNEAGSKEEIAREFADLTKRALNDTPVTIGSYQAK